MIPSLVKHLDNKHNNEDQLLASCRPGPSTPASSRAAVPTTAPSTTLGTSNAEPSSPAASVSRRALIKQRRVVRTSPAAAGAAIAASMMILLLASSRAVSSLSTAPAAAARAGWVSVPSSRGLQFIGGGSGGSVGSAWLRPQVPRASQRPNRRSMMMSSTSSSSSTSAAAAAVASSTATSAASQATRKVETRRVLSGVQPTGSLHLGNYLGAIRQWVDFQNNPSLLWDQEKDDENDDKNESGDADAATTTLTPAEIRTENYFCVVDLHAITMPHDPDQLEESTLASAALYLAAGIDPSKSNIFVQSHVPAHSELTWLLNCITPMNWLERMIQYKDKAKKQQLQGGDAGGGGGVGVGLFDYPVLMAADILLYQATHVPVGEDQRQHLELARDICRRFHDLFGKGNAYKKRCKRAGIPSRPVFVEPNAMIVKEGGARIMSLTDGTNKMSKSDPNDMSRINVLDPPDVIRNKIKRCKTDAIVGLEWDNPDRPEATNLLNIYAAVQPERSRDDIATEVKDMTWGEFKPVLADAVIAHLQPIQDRYQQVRNDPEYLSQVLAQGANAADAVASQTLRAARVAMGFTSPASSSS